MAKQVKSKTITKDAMSKEIKAVLLIGAGAIAGSLTGQMLDKMLKVDHNDTRMNLKKFVRPLVLIGAGATGSIKLSDENMKNLAKGVALSGILTATKVILRKDLLNGMTGFEGLGETDGYGDTITGLENLPVYYEPDNVGNPDNVYLLGSSAGTYDDDDYIGSYDPELPELQAAEDDYSDNEYISSTEDAQTLQIWESDTGESINYVENVL